MALISGHFDYTSLPGATNSDPLSKKTSSQLTTIEHLRDSYSHDSVTIKMVDLLGKHSIPEMEFKVKYMNGEPTKKNINCVEETFDEVRININNLERNNMPHSQEYIDNIKVSDMPCNIAWGQDGLKRIFVSFVVTKVNPENRIDPQVITLFHRYRQNIPEKDETLVSTTNVPFYGFDNSIDIDKWPRVEQLFTSQPVKTSSFREEFYRVLTPEEFSKIQRHSLVAICGVESPEPA